VYQQLLDGTYDVRPLAEQLEKVAKAKQLALAIRTAIAAKSAGQKISGESMEALLREASKITGLPLRKGEGWREWGLRQLGLLSTYEGIDITTAPEESEEEFLQRVTQPRGR